MEFLGHFLLNSGPRTVSLNSCHFLYQTSKKIQFTANFMFRTSIGKEEDVDFWGLLNPKEKKISDYMKTDIFSDNIKETRK
jgi:hypothetical protein